MIGPHPLQAEFDMGQDPGFVTGLALGGEHDLVAHIGERETDLLFTVGIGVGCVVIRDAAVKCGAQQADGVFFAAALKGQTAHGGLGHHQTGAAERDRFHVFVTPEKITNWLFTIEKAFGIITRAPNRSIISDGYGFVKLEQKEYAAVAQLDRVPDSDSGGRGFESRRPYHL